MILPTELLLPSKTIFKKGAVAQLAQECLEFGRQGIIVHGRSWEGYGKKQELENAFAGQDAAAVQWFLRQAGEPVLDEVSALIQKARSMKADWIAAIGGGSVLDLAKAAAGLYNADEEPAYYQEGGALKERGIPFIAVPTTAGSGSEATPNAVIINRQKKRKTSLRDRSFVARTVILDVALLADLPRPIISYSGMDAFVQAYEAYTSRNATWLSDTFALKAIDLINRNILPAYATRSEEALTPLLLGSYFSGVAFSSARLGVIHGIAHPLGVLYDQPHGLICAACLLPSIAVNRKAMGNKYEMMKTVMESDVAKRVRVLLSSLEIRSPFKGKPLIEKEKIIAETLQSGSTASSPKKITREDVEFILKELF